MRPISLDLQNARTFDSLHYDFSEGVTAITGPNGAGKTTLASAVDVALFGAESRSLADWLSTDRPEQTMTIALTFDHAGETYRVRRSFSGKGRGTTKVDLEKQDAYGDWWPLTRESAKATKSEVEELIGLNRRTFRASAYMKQGDASRFCDATAGERHEMLSDTLGLEVWAAHQKRARSDLAAAKESLAVVRSKIESAETELTERPALASQLFKAQEKEQAARSALAESESQLAKARERLSKLREAAGLREAAERAAAVATASLASLSDRIAALERQIKVDGERLAEKPGLEVVAEGLPGLERERGLLAGREQGWTERQRLQREVDLWEQTEIAEREKASDARTKAQQVIDGIGTEHCDRCGQVLGQDAAKTAFDSLADEAQAHDLASGSAKDLVLSVKAQMFKLPQLPPDFDRSDKVADMIRLGQEAQRSLAALAEVSERKTSAEAERKQMLAELPEREEAVRAATAQLEALGPQRPVKIEMVEQDLRNAEREEKDGRNAVWKIGKEIAIYEERLLRLEKLADESTRLEDEHDRLQQDVELLSHLDRACGPNGVPALILETSAIPQLEAEWNRLLGLLPTDSGDTFEVELHTQRERKTGDGAVDALDVIVYANGHARPYATYSGGEQMRISIAQRRALSNLLAHRKGADCPLMILDEPNSLDDQGMAALARVLQDLAAAENLTICVVSHDPALRDAFEQTVEIEKVDGRSRIVGSIQDTVPVAEAIS